MPILTVAIPTFNRSDTLVKTLNAVELGLKKLPNWQDEIEILISSNASTDNTAEVCQGYPDFKYFEQETNLGYDKNVLSLYQKASGDYILFISDDDVFEPTGLLSLIHLIREAPDTDVFFCSWYAVHNEQEKRNLLHSLITTYAPVFTFDKVSDVTPFYFLSSFALRRKLIISGSVMTDTYAVQMEIALLLLSKDSKCRVVDEFLIGRIEPETELIGGNNDSSRAWRIHLGFTRVRRKFQDKFSINISPVAELSSALTAWGFFSNPQKPLGQRLGVLLDALISGLRYSKYTKFYQLPKFIRQKYFRVST